jgi:two-component system CheB/CheR fusion protein
MSANKKTRAQPTRDREVLDANEAATLLSAHVETVRRLARRGEIPSFKLGKDWRFKRAALLHWAERQPPGDQPVAVRPEPEKAREKPYCFPIVGIGASAGGLEALEQFLRPLPADCGMAFVVVQHLDPTHKGMMAELLQRATPMKVVQVRDRLKVEPNRVYVIPPNKDMSILKGVLHLLAPAAPRGLRLPIDFFLRSLAADQRERSVGVILSGMGSDGTLGVRAIKEQAGAVFVQAPASAKFDGMPRSVIDAGLADIVAPVEELAAKTIAYLDHAPLAARPEPALASKTQSAIEKVCVLLRDQTGHDFSEYKRSTVYRRIERRMALHQLDSIASYVRYLQECPQETQLLFKELLIGVTSFFRDPAVWEQLRQKVIPALLAERPSGGTLRAWVPGCSTGEEAYSLAIVFKEALAQLRPVKSYSLQIFATDLDKDAIDKARQGVFPANIAGDVSAERLRRFFIKEEHGYLMGKEIRETVVFAPQNLIMDPPFTKLDILSCRNLLIYLSPELQKRLLPLFHYSVGPRGILLLGIAETVGAFTDLFAPVDGKTRIYRRIDAASRSESVIFPASSFAGRSTAAGRSSAQPSAQSAPSLQVLADQMLLTRYSPAAVLTNDKGDIVYVSGRTGKYLEPAAGKANWNIYAMAREGLRYELGSAFQKALRDKRTVTQSGVKVETIGGEQAVDMTIEPNATCRLRRAGPERAGAPADARGAAIDARGDADVSGGAQELQRGAAEHERGAAEHERGADDLQGGDAVAQRGAADAQPRAAVQGRRADAGEQRHEESAREHGHRHAVLGRRSERAAVHQPHNRSHQAHPERCGPAALGSVLGSGLSRPPRPRARRAADPRLEGEGSRHE